MVIGPLINSNSTYWTTNQDILDGKKETLVPTKQL